MNLTRKSLVLVALVFVALGSFSSQAQAQDRVYTFVNSTNHEVILGLYYPPGLALPPGSLTSMKLKPGVSWAYTMNSSLPNVRVDLSGGSWKDYKGNTFFIGTNPGANPAGTYTIK